MKIPPFNCACLLWSYRFNFYKAKGWRDGTAVFFAGINTSVVYVGILYTCIIFLTTLNDRVFRYTGVHISGFFVVLPPALLVTYYTSAKENAYRAVCQSMNPPGISVMFAVALYLLGSVMVPFVFSIAIHGKAPALLISSFICTALSVLIVDHWAAGQIRKLQATRAAELHGKHAPQ